MKIGMFLKNLDEEYQQSLVAGVDAESKRLGIDVVYVQGEIPEHPEFHSGPFFPSASLLALDGALILTSLIVSAFSEETGRKMLEPFGGIPVVTIGPPINGCHTVAIRTEAAMDALMDHLLQTHGYKRFLYVGGPRDNESNAVREHSFLAAIERARGDDATVSGAVRNGDLFSDQAGIAAITAYRREHPTRDVDVIVAGSDNIASGILGNIDSNPEGGWAGCPITGFDDLPQSRFEKPPLTTAHQPLGEMGACALRVIGGTVPGSPLPKPSVDDLMGVEARLIVRESCGCPAHGAAEEDDDPPWQLDQQQAIRLLQELRRFGQRLAGQNSFAGITRAIDNCLYHINPTRFFLFTVPREAQPQKGTATLRYARSPIPAEACLPLETTLHLADFFGSMISGSYYVSPLQTGNEELGLIVYETTPALLPYLCGGAVFVANTLRRLREFDSEKERRIAAEAEVLRISDLERLRFSMDLHDDICQRLAGISMICKNYAKRESGMQELAEMVAETLKRTREYARDSFPVGLGSVTVRESLQDLAQGFERSHGLKVKFDWPEGIGAQLPANHALNLYRIVQEALRNVCAHAETASARITARTEDNAFPLTIADGGKGFAFNRDEPRASLPGEESRRVRPEGIGLRSMEYRAHQLGADFTLRSAPGEGTSVTIRVPL